MNKKIISTLQLFPGPEIKSSNRIVERYLSLSEHSSGTVVAMSYKDETFMIGNYKCVFVGYSKTSQILSNIQLVAAIYREASILKQKGELDLIVSYDPLKIGFLGLLTKTLFKSKLLIEINSEIDSDALYQFNSSVILKIKRFFFPIIRKFILSKADGVKGLFDGQFDNIEFNKKAEIEYFFDHTPIAIGEYSSKTEKKILTMGFPVYIKGIDLLVRAFNKISQDDPVWSLELVGWFDNNEIEELNRLIGGNKNVMISEPISFSDVPAKIDNCSIFVLASRTEGMGRVLLESMARGRARIGSAVGGIPSVLQDNVDGLLVKPESVEDLYRKLDFLIRNEHERKRLAESGIKRFANEFTLDKFTEKSINLYHRILERKE